MARSPVPIFGEVFGADGFHKKIVGHIHPERRQIIGHIFRIEMDQLLENAERKVRRGVPRAVPSQFHQPP